MKPLDGRLQFSLHMMMADFEVTLEERIQLFEEYFQELLPENVDVSSLFYLKKFKASIDKNIERTESFRYHNSAKYI